MDNRPHRPEDATRPPGRSVPASADRSVVVGVVGKPFGISGACYVRPDPDVEHEFAAGTRYRTPAGELVVHHRHDHGARMVLTFVGVTGRDEAERLRGTVLRIDASRVRLGPESLWADDVVGLEVVAPDGTLLGVVDDLADGPAHDYLIVAPPGGEPVWVPAVDELITIESVRGSGGHRHSRVVATPLPGLFDPDEADSAQPDTAER